MGHACWAIRGDTQGTYELGANCDFHAGLVSGSEGGRSRMI